MKPNAFTLSEMLVTLCIISILAALAISGLSRAMDYTRTSKCSSNMRQLAQVTIFYTQDNNGTLPPTYRAPYSNTTLAWWQYLYPDYCRNPKVFKCPEDNTAWSNPNHAMTYLWKGQVLADGKVSYGIPGSKDSSPTVQGFTVAGQPLSRISAQSRTCFLTEYFMENKSLVGPYFGNFPNTLETDVQFPHGQRTRGNFAFLDGHIVSMTREQMLTANRNGEYNFGYSASW